MRMRSKYTPSILFDLLLIKDIIARTVAMQLESINHKADEGCAFSNEGLED